MEAVRKIETRIEFRVSKCAVSTCAVITGDGAYPPFGSLVRQGPVPFLVRLQDPQKC